MQLAPWPPPNHMVALPTTGIPMMAVPELCARHVAVELAIEYVARVEAAARG